MRRELGADTRPGIVVSVATSGDLLQWHVHLHVLGTDGTFSDDGAFHPLATWDQEALMRLFRERLLVRLVEKHAISRGAGHVWPVVWPQSSWLGGIRAFLRTSESR